MAPAAFATGAGFQSCQVSKAGFQFLGVAGLETPRGDAIERDHGRRAPGFDKIECDTERTKNKPDNVRALLVVLRPAQRPSAGDLQAALPPSMPLPLRRWATSTKPGCSTHQAVPMSRCR